MVGRAELLAMGTTAGARAAGWDAELGRLEPGALADLALLDLDAPAFAALNDAVDQWILAGGARAARTVIVGGRVVVEDGIPVAVDAPSVAAELRERLAAREDVAAASRHAALAALQGFIERTGWHRPGGKA
jgi:cytosine/adenosine deaminase-related metal-dependent hydrolase